MFDPMLKPAYRIQIGNETFESGTSGEVISIRVSLDMDTPADSFEIAFHPGTKSTKLKEGDTTSIQLGYADRLEDVIKGAVENVERGIAKTRITGLNRMAKLLELRVNQVYESQTAGAIVSDLANKAGVQTEKIADGINFPMYAIDDRKSAYMHIRELAKKCGFDLYMTTENKLVFAKYERQQPLQLEYGKEIIHAESTEEKPVVSGVIIQGESPSSFKGTDTAHWLTKRKVEGIAGNGAHRLIEDATVRDKDTAAKVAQALLEILSRGPSGVVETIGTAEVKLGGTIELKDMPNAKLSGEFRVRSVEHFMSKTAGFTTLIGWTK